MKKYAAILADIEQKIELGQFAPGQKLPSVRSAAAHYGCSVSTVTRAYAELEKSHAIYAAPQSGFYVVDKPAKEGDGRDDGVLDLASALPDIDLFPYLDFQHCLNKAIDTYKHDLFTYGSHQGMESLRRTLVNHLAVDQVFAKAEQIFIASGVQQTLEMLAKMPFPNGKEVILVEQPSYDIYLRFLETEGLPVRGIARTADGIDLAELEEMFQSGGIKFFYTMSRYHNPLGTSYTVREREAIARLADKYDVYVVEDDYMADLGEERCFDPIFAYSRKGHAIYLKSFSKIIFPGLRLGAAVLPLHLVETFHRYRRYPDTSLLSQAALDIYIKNGMYERHKRHICSQYAARIRAANEAIRRHNREGLVEASNVDSGIYIQLKVQPRVNLERLIARLEERGIRVVSGKRHYLSDFREREKFIRISISRADPERIDEGIRAIIEEVKRGGSW
ncbi:PLP-dependent aminotransferase family protein [Paenibacillus sp. FSL W8-0194]|uniref:aminotransferase-like domain-containing protein n=1 Tax=Paenibacillus sp. FSL W8-0194 TaxID=2921711 RepID=UPI0030D90389